MKLTMKGPIDVVLEGTPSEIFEMINTTITNGKTNNTAKLNNDFVTDILLRGLKDENNH